MPRQPCQGWGQRTQAVVCGPWYITTCQPGQTPLPKYLHIWGGPLASWSLLPLGDPTACGAALTCSCTTAKAWQGRTGGHFPSSTPLSSTAQVPGEGWSWGDPQAGPVHRR